MAKKDDAPTKKDDAPVVALGKLDRLAALKQALTKEFGTGVIRSGVDDIVLRIPTGSLRLDYSTSGGIPVGKVTTIWGGEGSGKTTTCLRIIANAQKLCANCYREPTYTETGPFCDCLRTGLFVPAKLPGSGKDGNESNDQFTARVKALSENSYEPIVSAYVNIEGDFDGGWARTLGVDMDSLMVSDHESGEEAVDVIEALIASGSIDLIVIDSLAMITPTKEAEESSAQALVGKQPLLINKAQRKWTLARVAAKRNYGKLVTVIQINQQRMKIDSYGGGPTMPGGLGQRFVGSLQIYMWGAKGDIEKIDIDKKDEEIEIATTAVTKYRIEKNKTGPTSGTQGIVKFCKTDCSHGKAGEVLELDDLIRVATHYEFIRKGDKPGEWYLFDTQYKTQKALIGDIVSDPVLYRKLRGESLRRMIANA